MHCNWFTHLLQIKTSSSLVFTATFLIFSSYSLPAQAQITPDESLGEQSSVVTPSVEVRGETADRVDGGVIRDRHLFHSFEEFNVEESQRVYFANPENVENIFSRITGNNPSNISGVLGVDGAADLLLLNPNGILFGENSSLDVEGSFLGTTADSLIFDNGSEFSAVRPHSPLLTISVPLGLQFGPNPGSISVSSFLEVPNGQNFSLIGGEINLIGSDIVDENIQGGGIFAPGGRVELGGLSTAGIVNFEDNSNLNFPEGITRANVSLNNNFFIDVTAGGGGSLAVYSQNLRLTNSFIGAGIDPSLELTEAQAGDINIDTIEATILEGNNDLSSVIQNITGDISEFLELSDHDIAINTAGNAGNIMINTGSFSATGSFFIGLFTNGEENAGSINIIAKDSIILESSLQDSSAIRSIVVSQSTGNAGDINIETNQLTVRNSDISTDNLLELGRAGDLNITASEFINLRGAGMSTNIDGNDFLSGLFTSVLSANTVAGNLTINTGRLTIADGAQVEAATFGAGNGGNITIKADEIQLVGAQGEENLFLPSAINALAFGSGDGGTVNISTNNLVIEDRAEITVSSLGGGGNSGKITAMVRDSLLLDNGNISATSESLIEENIESIDGNGGNIEIQTGNIRLRGDSNITTSVQSGTGGGGNITLSANSIVAFDDSDIFASSLDGQGGNITLDTPAFFAANFNADFLNANPDSLDLNNRVDLSASALVSGSIDIPDVNFLPNSPVELSEETIDANEVIANSCVVRNRQQGGTFTITGSGGLPVYPDDANISTYSTGTVRTIPEEKMMTADDDNWQLRDPIIEPEKIYRLSNGKLVLSRECG